MSIPNAILHKFAGSKDLNRNFRNFIYFEAPKKFSVLLGQTFWANGTARRPSSHQTFYQGVTLFTVFILKNLMRN